MHGRLPILLRGARPDCPFPKSTPMSWMQHTTNGSEEYYIIISCRNNIANREIWQRTGQEDMGNIIRRRLRWLEHVVRMEGERRAVHCTVYRPMDWSPEPLEGKHKRKTGRKLYVKTSDACMDYVVE